MTYTTKKRIKGKKALLFLPLKLPLFPFHLVLVWFLLFKFKKKKKKSRVREKKIGPISVNKQILYFIARHLLLVTWGRLDWEEWPLSLSKVTSRDCEVFEQNTSLQNWRKMFSSWMQPGDCSSKNREGFWGGGSHTFIASTNFSVFLQSAWLQHELPPESFHSHPPVKGYLLMLLNGLCAHGDTEPAADEHEPV